jgi:3-methyladenine DNA glycosylase AlkD
MMTVNDIMTQLRAMGSDSIKKILLKHGVKEPFFGVKVEYLKTIQKKVKKDYQLAKDLFATGNADAMYLAGLIADDKAMTKDDLQGWVDMAISNNISEYTVPWVAAEGNHGYEMALKWIDDRHEHVAAAGWNTLSNLVALKPNSELNIPALRKLFSRIASEIHTAPNRVHYTMNGFIISTACYVPELTDEALKTAEKIGEVTVDMDGTACKIPQAKEYVDKVVARGKLGVKKKTVKC